MNHHLNEKSLSEIMTAIDDMAVQVQLLISDEYEKKEENARQESSLNRLTIKIQKQFLFNKKLICEKCNIVKTKKEYEDELKYNKDINIRIKSTVDTQFEQMQRLSDEKEDRYVLFNNQQMKIMKEDFVYRECMLSTTRTQKNEKDNQYYKILCRTTLIMNILLNNDNLKTNDEYTEKRDILKLQFRDSAKNLKNILQRVDVFKSNMLSHFDCIYDGANKIDVLKLITSIFNTTITIGYMRYWKSKAEIFKLNVNLWTVKNTHGQPINFQTPFGNRTVISFPTEGSASFKDCYGLLKAVRPNEKTTKTDKKTDDGFNDLFII